MNNEIKPGRLCYMYPYCKILDNYGIGITEDYLLGLAKGVVFEYSYIHKYKSVSHPKNKKDIVSIVGSKSDIRKDILDLFGINFEEFYLDNVNEAISVCIEKVRKNESVIVFCDVFFLRYHPQYQKVHNQTNLILYSWNSYKSEFVFFDGHVTTIPITTYTGILASEELEQAFILGDNPYNGRKIGIITNNYVHESQNISIDEIVQEQAMNMLYPLKSEFSSGIDGIMHLADDMIWWLSFWGTEDMINVLRQMYHHVSGRGGPAICRLVYSDFLSAYFNGNKNIWEISQGFKEVSKKWTALSAKCFRYSLKFESENLMQIANDLRNIAQFEKVLFLELLREDKLYDNFKPC